MLNTTQKVFFNKRIEKLDLYNRSNQDTCLIHKPAVNIGEWVESGDLLADSSASMNGELAIGKNIIVAYMPWEGFNYEDAILINERLVYDDVYTSIHIERYEIETKESQLGSEQITREIPDIPPEAISHLDEMGIAKVGSWIEEGDILVGKVTPINKKSQTPYQRLLFKLLDKQLNSVRDSSLRAPKGIKANVIYVNILENTDGDYSIMPSRAKQKKKVVSTKTDKKNKAYALNTKISSSSNTPTSRSTQNLLLTIYGANRTLTKTLYPTVFSNKVVNSNNKQTSTNKSGNAAFQKWLTGSNSAKNNINAEQIEKPGFKLNRNANRKFGSLRFASQIVNTQMLRVTLDAEYNNFKNNNKIDLLVASNYSCGAASSKSLASNTCITTGVKINKLTKNTAKNTAKNIQNPNSANSKFSISTNHVHIYLAEKRKIQVGDKMAGRHGNKGIISNILPREDMPYLPDGTPIDIVLNPLGVPSRMNVGQIYECLLGLAGKYLGEHFRIFPFDEIYGAEASRSFVFAKLFEARKKTGIEWIFDPNTPGKMRIFDGRTCESFDQPVTVGVAYMLKLVHMVDDKIHARSTGPYSLVTQQPLRGRAKQGGQRLGEMEVWAIEGYGAAFVLLEMLTLKSDDMTGRLTLWSNLILNKEIMIGTPESFKVLVCELQALCLDIGLFHYTQRNKPLNNSVSNTESSKPLLQEISHLMLLP